MKSFEDDFGDLCTFARPSQSKISCGQKGQIQPQFGAGSLKRRVHWANYVFIIDPYESYLNTVDPGSILTLPWQIFKLKHYCSILANSPGTTSVAFRHLMSSFHAYPREEAARQRAAPHSFATLLCDLSPTPDLQPLNWMILFFNLLGFARLAS